MGDLVCHVSQSAIIKKRKFGRIRNPRSETQCKGGSDAENCGNFKFHVADGSVELAGIDQVFRNRVILHEGRCTMMFFKESRTGLSTRTHKRMSQKPKTISGESLGVVFTVITSSLEYISLWRMRDHSQYHSCVSMLPSGRILHWRAALTILGTLSGP